MSVYPAVVGKHARLPHWASLPVIVAVLGLSVTLLVTGVLHQAEQRRGEALLDRQADVVEAAVRAEAHRYVDTLTDLTAAVGAQAQLSARGYDAIMSGLSSKRLLGATSVSLVLPTSRNELPDLPLTWARPGQADALVPGGAVPAHRFVVLNRRLDGGLPRVGGDAARIRQAREAMDRSIERGAPTASQTYMFSREARLPANQRQLSFVVAAPVRAVGDAGAGSFGGWLLMGMRGQDFLRETLKGVAAGEVAVELRDGDPTTGRLVASWPVGLTGLAGQAGQAAKGAMATGATADGARGVKHLWVPIAGRMWSLSVSPIEGFARPDGALDTVVLASGTAIGLLLAGLVGVLTRSRDRALIEVGNATAALRADVARRKQVEVELRRRERELAGFAGVAAHDLRSPLSAASAYLEVFADEVGSELGRENLEFLDRARSAIARTGRMLTDLLGYATADQVVLNRCAVDLGALAAEVVAERTDRLPPDPERIRLGALPVVQGDPGMLRQVLDNLVGNALKYTAPDQPPRVSVTGQRVGVGWRIEVADRGIGISTIDRDGVFDAFHRGAGSAGFAGSGLGLAICRRIAERHGGMIGVVDNPGGGSVFWFTLPET